MNLSETSYKRGRTDLALEVSERFEQDNVEVKGVILKETYHKNKEIKVTTVTVENEQGAKVMGKPIGTYITIEAPKLSEEDESYHKPLSKEIAKYLKKLMGEKKSEHVLVVGLGNRDITPDALGPEVVDNLFVTRHLIREYGQEFKEHNKMENMSAIAPGVMGQTGMEVSEILRGIIRETKPELVIVIDALAARSMERLNTTIQITDTGISPGSGVGNNRKALNEEGLGVKVIAIGCPTVVDASTIVYDTMENFMSDKGFSEDEVNNFIKEVGDMTIKNMFVTPKNIDEAIKKTSYTISEALNSCFCESLTE
ncbi:spore protease [Mobilisporobacter senegalensis]|uniref:Germination protease n=2 Tax=Mobilisporobacter senegalensis TaxID=1329262 RepID=A0A3N1Y056_9FIRM|nr:spore protease [Mobilisporobacter senegalensis]